MTSGVTMSTGKLTSAAVDADGHLCVWGKLESPTHEPVGEPIFRYKNPTIVQTARVKSVSTGIGHILVLTTTGEVLSFGSGWYGRLGHGDEEDQLEPKVIEALRGTRVVAIAAGAEHSMVLTDEGAVLSFGQGSHGYPLGYLRGRKLGDGEEEDQPVPKVIKALRGTRVVAIATCDRHSMVLTDEGTVLSLGYESNGPLGHGGKKNQCTPKLIAGLQAYRSLKQPAGSYPDKQPKPTGGSA